MKQTTLERVHDYPYLGVTIFDDLSWSNHVHKIKSKATHSLGMLSLVRLQLEYSSAVWDLHLQKDIDELFEMVQRRAERFVCEDYRREEDVVTDVITGLVANCNSSRTSRTPNANTQSGIKHSTLATNSVSLLAQPASQPTHHALTYTNILATNSAILSFPRTVPERSKPARLDLSVVL